MSEGEDEGFGGGGAMALLSVGGETAVTCGSGGGDMVKLGGVGFGFEAR